MYSAAKSGQTCWKCVEEMELRSLSENQQLDSLKVL